MKKAAVIGLGDIAPIHLAAITANPEITLGALCDTDPEKRAMCEEKYPGVPFLYDYQEMVRAERPDCVHVCLPHWLHYPVSAWCAGQGVHVFCEKPSPSTRRRAGSSWRSKPPTRSCTLASACRTVSMNRSRCSRASSTAASTARSRPPRASCLVPPQILLRRQTLRGRWETAGGGCMINQSVHTLDLLYFLGGDIASLKASVTQAARLRHRGGGHRRRAPALCQRRGGAVMATNANYQNESVQIGVQLGEGKLRHHGTACCTKSRRTASAPPV